MPTPGTSVLPIGPGDQTTRPLWFHATDGAASQQLHQTMSTGTLLPETVATLLSARQPHTLEVYALRQKATAVKPISGRFHLPIWRMDVSDPETFDQTPLTPRGATSFQAGAPRIVVPLGIACDRTHPRQDTPKTTESHHQRQAGPPAFYSLCPRSSRIEVACTLPGKQHAKKLNETKT